MSSSSNIAHLKVTLGQGASSTFQVAAERETHPRQQMPSSLDAGPLVGVPVLIVDDNDVIRWMLSEFTLGWRMRPTVVKDAHTAIAAMEHADQTNGPFPLVLLSLNIRGSKAVFEYLKQHPKVSRTTIALLSSIHMQNDMTRCCNIGVAASITKPVKRAELLAILLSVLTQKAQSRWEPTTSRHTGAVMAPLRILVVDDNAVNRKLATAMLGRMGHTVTAVVNGREALSQYATEVYQLIFMDILMPEMDGIATTRAIREIERTGDRHTPIIALTAQALTEDRERCLEAGMDGYISKPFRASDLAVEIERVLTIDRMVTALPRCSLTKNGDR